MNISFQKIEWPWKAPLPNPNVRRKTFATFSWKLGWNDKSRPCVTQSDGAMHWHHISMRAFDRMAACAQACLGFPQNDWNEKLGSSEPGLQFRHIHLVGRNKSCTRSEVQQICLQVFLCASYAVIISVNTKRFMAGKTGKCKMHLNLVGPRCIRCYSTTDLAKVWLQSDIKLIPLSCSRTMRLHNLIHYH